MKKLGRLILSFIALGIIIFLVTGMNFPTLITCGLIVWIAAAKEEEPIKSPIVWLVCGIVIFIGTGYEAYVNLNEIIHPITEDRIADEIIREALNEISKKEFIYNTLRSIIAALIVVLSIIKIKRAET